MFFPLNCNWADNDHLNVFKPIHIIMKNHRQNVCSGLTSNRKCKAPTASRWCWVGPAVNTCSSARSQFWTRVYRGTAQGHSASQAATVLVNSCRWALNYWLPPSRAAQSACGYSQATQLSAYSYRVLIKFSRKQGVFRHRAILIFGDRDVAWGY